MACNLKPVKSRWKFHWVRCLQVQLCILGEVKQMPWSQAVKFKTPKKTKHVFVRPFIMVLVYVGACVTLVFVWSICKAKYSQSLYPKGESLRQRYVLLYLAEHNSQTICNVSYAYFCCWPGHSVIRWLPETLPFVLTPESHQGHPRNERQQLSIEFLHMLHHPINARTIQN